MNTEQLRVFSGRKYAIGTFFLSSFHQLPPPPPLHPPPHTKMKHTYGGRRQGAATSNRGEKSDNCKV